MSIISDVLTAARGGIKERDEKISDLQKKLESMTESRAYYRRERDTCLELVKESGEKYAELQAQVAEAEAMARSFASDFDLALPDPPEPDEPSPEDVAQPDPETDPEPAADGGEEA